MRSFSLRNRDTLTFLENDIVAMLLRTTVCTSLWWKAHVSSQMMKTLNTLNTVIYNNATSSFLLQWCVFIWHYGSLIGAPIQWNSGPAGEPNQSCGSWTIFFCKHFLLLQYISMAAGQVGENNYSIQLLGFIVSVCMATNSNNSKGLMYSGKWKELFSHTSGSHSQANSCQLTFLFLKPIQPSIIHNNLGKIW